MYKIFCSPYIYFVTLTPAYTPAMPLSPPRLPWDVMAWWDVEADAEAWERKKMEKAEKEQREKMEKAEKNRGRRWKKV